MRDVLFRNRIVVSLMCQYSSEDGFANDWRLVHLGSRAVGGAALVFTETGGWTGEDSAALAQRLKSLGVDLIDCSSGGNCAAGENSDRPRLPTAVRRRSGGKRRSRPARSA